MIARQGTRSADLRTRRCGRERFSSVFDHASDEYSVATEIYRRLVKSDLTGIHGHVVGARLRLSMSHSWCMHDGHVTDCPIPPLRFIALASGDWTHGTDHLVSGARYLAVPRGSDGGSGNDVAPDRTAEIHADVASGCTFTLDVTTAIRDWIASGLSNQGFALSRGDGQGNVESNDYVIATYGDFHLEVNCLPT